MAYYRVRFKAETWGAFKDGVLSAKTGAAMAVDTEFYGTVVGRQNVSEHVVVKVGSLYTKFMWLTQIPDPQEPPVEPPVEPPADPLPVNQRKLRIWGDPVMKQWGFDVVTVGTTNWQNIPLYNTATKNFGAVANFLWIDRPWIDYLKSLQFGETIYPNGTPVYHSPRSKMKWLCSDNGKIYIRAAEWETASRIGWGTTSIGGNIVTIEDLKTMRVPDRRTGGTVSLEMAKVKCFRKADRDKSLSELLTDGLVHRCYCVYKNNQFGDTPKGVIFSPMWSPLDWDFAGSLQPDGFWLPTVWMY